MRYLTTLTAMFFPAAAFAVDVVYISVAGENLSWGLI